MDSVDIFISYAWRDNEPPVGVGVDPKKDRWVWMFHDALQKALSINLGRDAFVWIDKREIKTNDRVETVLSNELSRSRLLLTLMSPSWLNSDWCQLELNEFKRSHPGTKTSEFVFVVEVEPVPRASWQELVAVKGLQFYTQQPSGAGHIRFGYPLPSLTDAEYHKQIVWLA